MNIINKYNNIISICSFIHEYKFVRITYKERSIGITYGYKLWIMYGPMFVDKIYRPISVNNTYRSIYVKNSCGPISVDNTYRFMFVNNIKNINNNNNKYMIKKLILM